MLLPYERSLLVVVALGLVMGLVSFVGARGRTARANLFDGDRLVRKLIGLGATWVALAAVYALFPEYAGAFYQPCWAALAKIALPLACVTPLYVWYVDRHQTASEDALAGLGAWILRWPGVSWDTALSQHALGWVVKGFFLPLMFVYLTNDLVQLQRDLDGAAPTTFMGAYDQLYRLGYLVDLAFTVVGYTFTLKLLDTHARSIEATAYGWAVCVLCYQPFWSVIGRQYLAYDDDGLMWGPALEGHPGLQYVWGGAILALVWIYAWATVTFGLRFSNLSHRGVFTSGPYRWTKHPAYLSKNVSW